MLPNDLKVGGTICGVAAVVGFILGAMSHPVLGVAMAVAAFFVANGIVAAATEHPRNRR